MNCRNCGKEVNQQAIACPSCGVPPLKGNKFCQNCGAPTDAAQVMCVKCGVALGRGAGGGGGSGGGGGAKSKVAAGLLGIFLGAFGIHKFYLGYTKPAVIMLVASLVGGIVTLGIAPLIIGLIGFIEGIIYLTKSDDEFEATYVRAEKAWF